MTLEHAATLLDCYTPSWNNPRNRQTGTWEFSCEDSCGMLEAKEALTLLGHAWTMEVNPDHPGDGLSVLRYYRNPILSGESAPVSAQAPGEQTNHNQTKGNNMLYRITIYTKPTVEAAQAGELEKIVLPTVDVLATNPNAAIAVAVSQNQDKLDKVELQNAVIVNQQVG